MNLNLRTLTFLLLIPLMAFGQEPESTDDPAVASPDDASFAPEPETDEVPPEPEMTPTEPEATPASAETGVTPDDAAGTGDGSDLPAAEIDMGFEEDEIPDITAEEEETAGGFPPADVTVEFPEPETGGGAALFAEDETISVDFPEEDIRTILRNVADLYDLNLVIPDTLAGSTSIKLRNVTWRQVFEVVLEPIGFTYVEDRNIIKVKSLTDLEAEPVVTRVFVINYADASEIQGSVSVLVDSAAGGRIQVDQRSNALVITERPSKMNGIQEIIERLDRPTEQVLIESKFVEVTNRDVKNIGVDWSSLNGYGISMDGFTRAFDRSRGRTLDTGVNNSSGQNTSNTTGSTDTSESTFTSANSFTNSSELVVDNLSGGVTTDTNSSSNTRTDSSSLTNDNTSTNTTNTTVTDAFDSFRNLVNNSSIGRVDSTVFNASSFNLVISALQSLNDVKLVSNPTVVTLNNTEALISIGERFPIPQYTYNDERGTFEVSGFEYTDIGINLNVVPQVNSAGFINLNIRPEVSSRSGTVSFGGASGAEIPIIASRRTESTITIKDGFTLAIGGLMENTSQTDETKVPVLGNIPVLGRLFRSNSDDINTRNLIIFITARTLNPDGSTYRDIIDPRTLNDMGINPRDVPGYELPDEERRALDEIYEMRGELESEKESRELDTLLQRIDPETAEETRKPWWDRS
ncbi:MAG: secretin N-terminal domain-containing protein [Opitutales bacterium]